MAIIDCAAADICWSRDSAWMQAEATNVQKSIIDKAVQTTVFRQWLLEPIGSSFMYASINTHACLVGVPCDNTMYTVKHDDDIVVIILRYIHRIPLRSEHCPAPQEARTRYS